MRDIGTPSFRSPPGLGFTALQRQRRNDLFPRHEVKFQQRCIAAQCGGALAHPRRGAAHHREHSQAARAVDEALTLLRSRPLQRSLMLTGITCPNCGHIGVPPPSRFRACSSAQNADTARSSRAADRRRALPAMNRRPGARPGNGTPTPKRLRARRRLRPDRARPFAFTIMLTDRPLPIVALLGV
jgi:hypothetical protein